MQIFAPSKFRIDRTTGSEVMAKKFICGQNNFLAITFEPVHCIRDFSAWRLRDTFYAIIYQTKNNIEKNRVRINLAHKKSPFEPVKFFITFRMA